MDELRIRDQFKVLIRLAQPCFVGEVDLAHFVFTHGGYANTAENRTSFNAALQCMVTSGELRAITMYTLES